MSNYGSDFLGFDSSLFSTGTEFEIPPIEFTAQPYNPFPTADSTVDDPIYMALDELSANNHVGNNLFDHMSMNAVDWLGEIEPAVGDDVPTLDNDLPPDIVVIGRRNSSTGAIVWVSSGGGIEPPSPIGDDTSTVEPNDGSEPTDEEVVEVRINISNLTPEQKAAIEAWLQAISRQGEAIKGLADDARIRLYNGSVVTGSELKELWAKTDFVINPDSVSYPGNQNRGNADYNGGNPIISRGITNLYNYSTYGQAGMNYLVGHELGHLTVANRNHDGTSPDAGGGFEQMANDISRAIATRDGLAVLPQFIDPRGEAYNRYSTEDPLAFTAP